MKKKYDEYKITVEEPLNFKDFVKSTETTELKNLYENNSPRKGGMLLWEAKRHWSSKKVDNDILNLINESIES